MNEIEKMYENAGIEPEWVEILDIELYKLKIKEKYNTQSLYEAFIKEEQCQ